MKKRIMAMLLAASLMVGMQNGILLAAGDETKMAGIEENSKELLEGAAAKSGEAEIIASGTCGASLTYQLDADGVLQISGTGEMTSYDYYGGPWGKNAEAVKEVLIEEGVTSIGDHAFCECSNLISVTIPEGVTSIGDYAFDECSNLISVTIPESVTSIGDGTFGGCVSLTSVEIPENVTSIGESVFRSCISLTSVTIPEGVMSISDSMLAGCLRLTSVEIPESVTSIGDGTFCYCASLTSVTIPEGVTSIGDNAFAECVSLTRVEIPESVSSIGESAFWECKSLTKVIIPEGVTSIDTETFWGCVNLTRVEIPESVSSIGESAFAGCASLTSVKIPEGVKKIGALAFGACYSLTSVKIPKSVTLIAKDAFEVCKLLKDVYYTGSEDEWKKKNFDTSFNGLDVTMHYNSTEIPEECLHSTTKIINEKEATCTEPGYTGDIWCSDCEQIIESGTEIEANGHKIVIDKEVPATCTREGKTAGSHCFVCHAVLKEQESIPANGHTEVIDKEVPATCTREGKTAGSHCLVCHTVLKAQESIPANGHTEVIDKEVPATCTREGKTAGSHCLVCHAVLKEQESIPANGHTYKTITTPATLAQNGSIVTKCTVCGAKKTAETIYRPETIKVSKTTFTYNGRDQKPAVTVKDGQGKTITSSYYTVSYKNCKNVGEATATVTFKGKYKGTEKLTYKIVPENTSLLQVGAISKGFTVKWKKQSSQTTGYQIQYSASINFKGAKTQTIGNNRTTSYTAKKLKAGQKYYVRIRTYKRAKVSGAYQNVYSAWSKAKTIKTKK